LALMPEGLLQYEMTGKEPERNGNRDLVMAPHETYRAAGDDKWVSIAVGSEDEWRVLCRSMGNPALAEDPRFKTAALRKQNEDALDEIITAWTSQHDRWEITQMLQAVGVAAFPAMTNKDIAEDRQLLERGFLVELEHPEIGKRKHAGIPWRMSGTPCEVRSPAPLRGADTEEVFKSLLEYTSDKVEQLRKAGILL
jgi:crotonobetainyl-CoA:carnitine CoA-transferase CaiB-like acyl-CoA transferase